MYTLDKTMNHTIMCDKMFGFL